MKNEWKLVSELFEILQLQLAAEWEYHARRQKMIEKLMRLVRRIEPVLKKELDRTTA